VVGSDLEDLGWITQPVYLVQHHAPSVHAVEKALRVFEQLAYPRALAVEVLDPLQTLCEHRLAGAADPGEPHHPSLFPRLVYPPKPGCAPNHARW
jgi:hypothetical protein